MTTKEQERKALEKIRKIVEELGENSYLATAFDGAWEIAEENIENDFGNSTKFYVDKYNGTDSRAVAAENKIRELTAEVEFQKGEAEFHKKAFVEKNNDYHEACDKVGELIKARQDAEDKIESLELEVMKLKAKLYDYMVKED